MGNMGYCRFRNTLEDLKNCLEHIDDEDLSEEEEEARKELKSVCSEIAEE